MKKLHLTAAVISTSVFAFGTAYAFTATADLTVGATITATCIASTTAVDFGSVASGSGATATGAVGVNCTSGTNYTVALGAGANDDTVTRRITDGTNFLSYTLSDNATAALWGDASTFGATVSGTGTGAAQSYVVDAALTGAAVPAGAYSDTVLVTVTY